MIKKFKLFGLFNVLDLFVIAAIIAVITGTVYKYSIPGMSGDNSKIVYTIVVSSTRNFTLKHYQPGLKCFDFKTGEFIGVIKEVRSEPAYDFLTMDNGEIIVAEIPESLRLEIDIETECSETENGYFARGVYELKVGSEVPLATKYVEITTSLTQIRK